MILPAMAFGSDVPASEPAATHAAAQAAACEETATELKAPFDEAAAVEFLKQFEGKWQGHYTIKTINGKQVQSIQTQSEYYWDRSKTPNVLMGKTTYVVDNIPHQTESETVIENTQILGIVSENGQQKFFSGTINYQENAISWTPASATYPLDENLKQSFKQTPNGIEMLTHGFENLRNGSQNILLSINGVEQKQAL